MSDPQQPHGLQPSRLLRPWDFPGKSTGVGCHCLLRLCFLTHPNPSKPARSLSHLVLLCNSSAPTLSRPPSLLLLASVASLQRPSGSFSVLSYYSPHILISSHFPMELKLHAMACKCPHQPRPCLLSSFPTVHPGLTILQPHCPSSHTH